MARLLAKKETERRSGVDELIHFYALATEKIIYLAPGHVVAEYKRLYGVKIQKDFVIRRYNANGIYYDNGLWVKVRK